MKRPGRILAALAMVFSFIFIIGALGSAGGCSGSSGTIEQATRDEAADQVAQDKMREYMTKNPPKSAKKK
jgi:hypothetical protein